MKKKKVYPPLQRITYVTFRALQYAQDAEFQNFYHTK